MRKYTNRHRSQMQTPITVPEEVAEFFVWVAIQQGIVVQQGIILARLAAVVVLRSALSTRNDIRVPFGHGSTGIWERCMGRLFRFGDLTLNY